MIASEDVCSNQENSHDPFEFFFNRPVAVLVCTSVKTKLLCYLDDFSASCFGPFTPQSMALWMYMNQLS